MANQNNLDGRNFFYLFYSGARKILEHQQEINKLNVFPVPDADTGTNLASTVRAIIETIKPNRSYKETTGIIAEAALIGARGNSGVIFAQFLNGIHEETDDCHTISLEEFAITLKNSIRYLYDAIAEPVEGTMLTVIREWSEFMYEHKNSNSDFRSVFIKSLEAAKKSLKETPQKLKVLAKAGVVDAGAKGFVLFLEGMIEFLKNYDLKKLISAHQDIEIVEEIPEMSHETFNYRFCTEALIKGESLEKTRIESTVKSYGDSVVIAGTQKMMRIHVHTDHPEKLMDELRHLGSIAYQKADDMRKQFMAAHQRKWNIAIVTDSGCDLPEEILNHYQVHIIPMNLIIGENQYLDKVTITPTQFYNILGNTSQKTSTSQPSEKAFTNLYSNLLTHYDSILSVHFSKELSGTWRGAKVAAEKVTAETGKQISVLNSKTLSGAMGLLVYRVGMAIEAGRGHQEIVDNFLNWSNRSEVLVSVKSMKKIVESGRVSKVKGFIAQMLQIKPIVAVNNQGSTY
ncbi:MAG: DegV family protein, partial [Bacteroidota bacterium]|nr:DegV family protein [Bacteroidota bacterium]